jgi:hypothetical protein
MMEYTASKPCVTGLHSFTLQGATVVEHAVCTSQGVQGTMTWHTNIYRKLYNLCAITCFGQHTCKIRWLHTSFSCLPRNLKPIYQSETRKGEGIYIFPIYYKVRQLTTRNIPFNSWSYSLLYLLTSSDYNSNQKSVTSSTGTHRIYIGKR